MNAGRRLSVLLYLSIQPLLHAQNVSYIFGRVLDPSDAVVPGASVSVVNQDSGLRRLAETGPDGIFRVGSLRGGMYKVTVRKQGFVGMVRFDVKLAPFETARADFKLTVGAVQETITVEDTPSLENAEDPSIGVRVFHDEIRRLPLNGRGILGLVELSPGTNVTPATRGESGQFTANGQRPNANYFTIDGASGNTGVVAGGLPAQATGGVLPSMSAFGSLDSLLPVEAVEEFRVQTANTPGELGRLPGASVSLTSRSGSNEIHGGITYRVRHELVSANDWFANYSGENRGPLRLNDVNPSLGGPLWRNHTFFFLSFEHMSLRGPYVYQQPVPSREARRTAPEWVLPALNLFPQPNGGSLGNGVAAWYGRNIRPSQLDSGVVRIDHSLTSRVTLFARYNDAPSSNQFGSIEVNRLNLRFRSLTAGATLRPDSHWTADLRLNESVAEAGSAWSQYGQPSATCDLSPLTTYLFPLLNSCPALVRFWIGGVGQVINGREGDRRQRQFQVVESTSATLGRHAIRFGVDYRRIVPTRHDAANVLSIIADDMTMLVDRKDLWLGSSDAVNASTKASELSSWAQDTWQISSRLTVTPGLRWEYNPAPNPAGTSNFLNAGGTNFDQLHRPLWPAAYRNFAPRLSAVWRITRNGNTVLRAGGGLFYDSSLSIATDLLNNGPLNITQFLSGRAGLFTSILSYGFDRALTMPRLSQWNLTLDRAIGRNDTISLGYVGSRGTGLIRREIGGLGNRPSALFALTSNHGSSVYEGLQLQFRRRTTRNLQMLVSYSWSHSLDNDSSDGSLLWTGATASATQDYGSSDFDVRHSASATVTYQAPARLGGWVIDSMWRARSGFPISVLINEQYQGIPLANAFRPTQLPGVSVWLTDPAAPGGRRINGAAFAPAPPGVQGTLGRNSLAGFGMSQMDLAIRREWRWKDRSLLELRLESYNALNQANFADPVRYLNSPIFGRSTSMLNLMLGTGSPGSGLAPLLQTGGARNFQMVVRFHF